MNFSEVKSLGDKIVIDITIPVHVQSFGEKTPADKIADAAGKYVRKLNLEKLTNDEDPFRCSLFIYTKHVNNIPDETVIKATGYMVSEHPDAHKVREFLTSQIFITFSNYVNHNLRDTRIRSINVDIFLKDHKGSIHADIPKCQIEDLA